VCQAYAWLSHYSSQFLKGVMLKRKELTYLFIYRVNKYTKARVKNISYSEFVTLSLSLTSAISTHLIAILV